MRDKLGHEKKVDLDLEVLMRGTVWHGSGVTLYKRQCGQMARPEEWDSGDLVSVPGCATNSACEASHFLSLRPSVSPSLK